MKAIQRIRCRKGITDVEGARRMVGEAKSRREEDEGEDDGD